MNEKLLNELLPIVEKTKEGILKAIEMLQVQFPDLIKQIYAWETTVSIIGIVIGLLLIIIPSFFVKRINQIDKDNRDTVFKAIYILSWIISIPFIIPNIMKIVQIIVAPKLYLINYIPLLLNRIN